MITADSAEARGAVRPSARRAAFRMVLTGRIRRIPGKTKSLDQFTEDLTAKGDAAGKIDPVLGRDFEDQTDRRHSSRVAVRITRSSPVKPALEKRRLLKDSHFA